VTTGRSSGLNADEPHLFLFAAKQNSELNVAKQKRSAYTIAKQVTRENPWW
jgi:hypothetical protein